MENFILVQEGHHIKVEQTGSLNVALIEKSCSSRVVQSSCKDSDEEIDNICLQVVQDLVEKVDRNLRIEQAEQTLVQIEGRLISQETHTKSTHTEIQSRNNMIQEGDEENEDAEQALIQIEGRRLISQETQTESTPAEIQSTTNMIQEHDEENEDAEQALVEIEDRRLISQETHTESTPTEIQSTTNIIQESDKEKDVDRHSRRLEESVRNKKQCTVCTRSMTRRLTSQDTETQTESSTISVTPTESVSYEMVIGALREIKNNVKMNFIDLEKFICEKFNKKVPNLRKVLNLGVKRGTIQKSTGIKGLVHYEIKESSGTNNVSTTVDEDSTSEIDLTYKKTNTETMFKVSQKKSPHWEKYG